MLMESWNRAQESWNSSVQGTEAMESCPGELEFEGGGNGSGGIVPGGARIRRSRERKVWNRAQESRFRRFRERKVWNRAQES